MAQSDGNAIITYRLIEGDRTKVIYVKSKCEMIIAARRGSRPPRCRGYVPAKGINATLLPCAPNPAPSAPAPARAANWKCKYVLTPLSPPPAARRSRSSLVLDGVCEILHCWNLVKEYEDK